MIKFKKLRQEFAQDKTSIANIESVIAKIKEQQHNDNEDGPMPPVQYYFKDDWLKEMRERADMIHSRCFYLVTFPPYQATNNSKKFLRTITFQLMVVKPLYSNV